MLLQLAAVALLLLAAGQYTSTCANFSTIASQLIDYGCITRGFKDCSGRGFSKLVLITCLYSAGQPAAAADPDCLLIPKPVCGEDGFSYINKCVAALSKVAVKHAGYCEG